MPRRAVCCGIEKPFSVPTHTRCASLDDAGGLNARTERGIDRSDANASDRTHARTHARTRSVRRRTDGRTRRAREILKGNGLEPWRLRGICSRAWARSWIGANGCSRVLTLRADSRRVAFLVHERRVRLTTSSQSIKRFEQTGTSHTYRNKPRRESPWRSACLNCAVRMRSRRC